MSTTGAHLAGKRVVVLGLGLFGGGAGAARWALARGARVCVTDLRDAGTLARTIDELEGWARAHATGELRFVLGRHDDADLGGADLLIVNPAVPPGARPLGVARAAGVQVTTATALLVGAARCRLVGVTGTNGKTSTVRLVRDVLSATLPGAPRVEVGGNIGGSLLDSIETFGPEDVAVLELSSYQLEHLPEGTRRGLDLAIVTNIGVDHLARHGTLAAYRAAKLRLFELLGPGGTAIIPPTISAAEVEARAPCARTLTFGPGNALDLGEGAVRLDGEALGRLADLRAPGAHQRWNLAVALAAGRLLGATVDALGRAVAGLTGPPHRLESLGWFAADGAPFEVVDNGVSTTPESTLDALEWLTERTPRPRVLVAGGQAKEGQDYGALARFARQNGWDVLGFGASATLFEPDVPTPPRALESALAEAYARAAGGCLLFSPACASFDAFANFEARTAAFRASLARSTVSVLPERAAPRD